MKRYKLGIFGDSFCDPKGPFEGDGWYHKLLELTDLTPDDVYIVAESGVSNWYIYSHAIHALNNYDFDNIVFGFTNGVRLPVLDDELRGISYVGTPKCEYYENGPMADTEDLLTYNTDHPMNKYTVKDLLEIWHNVFNDDQASLVTFVSKWCIKELTTIAKKRKINVVNFAPFSCMFNNKIIDHEKTYGHIIHNLDNASIAEMQRNTHPNSEVEWFDPQGLDARCNHFTAHNNTVLAKEIWRLLNTPAIQRNLIDFARHPELDVSANCLDKYGIITLDPEQE